MSKKIRFSLEMEHGTKVRSIEELKEHFFLPQVLMYITNGKMITWLRDRYEDEIAEAIEALDSGDDNLVRKVCDIFDVPFDEDYAIDIEKAEGRSRKLKQLKEYTSESVFIDHLDHIAFTQEDVYDLLDENQSEIYLCGEQFSIPLGKKGVSYIGINNPIVIINSKEVVDWIGKSISLENIRFDEKYQRVEDNAREQEEVSQEVLHEWESYSTHSFLDFMMAPSEKEESEGCYKKVRKIVYNLNYDIDLDIQEIKGKLLKANLIGLAGNYLNSL